MTGWSGHDQRLTPRQREILERIARGHTNTQIATDLGIGFETVKMHVSHILRELGVSSREEAAAWWRETHRPLTRLRALMAVGFSARMWATVGAVAAGVAGVAVVAVAIALASAGGDDADPPPAAVSQATGTVTPATTEAAGSATAPATGTVQPAPSPTPTPPGMGYEAAAALLELELVSVEGDALHTRVVVGISGHGHELGELFRETGYPVFWLTDATGQRQQIQGSEDPATGHWVLDGWAIPETPGTLTIEARPVREYVVPAVPAGAPDPVWAHWDVPWTGYTSTTRSIALPGPNPAPFGDGIAVVDEILRTDTVTRIRWHIEGFASPQDIPEIHWRYLVFDAATGEPLRAHGGGTGDGTVRGGIVEFDNPSGDVVLLLRGSDDVLQALSECENVRQVGNGLACDDPPPPPGWDNLSELRKHNGPTAEFHIDLPH